MAQNNDLFSKESYWQEFINYLSSGTNGDKVKQNSLNLPKPNDLNWYPIRFGNSRINIEHSFNSKKRTIRASLIIKNDPDLFNRIEADKSSVEAQLTGHGGTVQWDGASKAMHINVLLDGQDVSDPQTRSSQFEWFAALTFELKSVADAYDGNKSAAPQPDIQPKKVTTAPAPKAPARPKAETPRTQPTVTAADPNRKQKIMELLADLLGLSAEASRYKEDSEEIRAKCKEQDAIVSELKKIVSDPQCKDSITDAKFNMDQSDPKCQLAELLDIFTSNITAPIYNLKFTYFGLKETFELLLLLHQCGATKAAYYIARCYGSGLIGLDEKEEVFVLRPDPKLALKYYGEAIAGGHYQAALEVGCLSMAIHDDEGARTMFRFAMEHNIPEAEVYLNYIENYPDREDVYSLFSSIEQSFFDSGYINNYKRHCGCNCIEYKGYLYFIEVPDHYLGEAILYGVNASDGQKQQLLKFKKNSKMSYNSPLENEQMFSIANDQIFLPVGDPDAIIKVGLDGSDPCYLKDLKGKSRNDIITRPLAFSSFMVYQRGSSTLYRYDYNTGTSTKLTQFTGKITGISEKEIVFDNQRVLKLDTLEKVIVQKVYPALKGKKEEDIILIDCTREIAYYIDKSQEKIFGTDKNGKIVDIWNFPRILRWCKWDYYDTHCFNGVRWTCKYQYKGVMKGLWLTYLSDDETYPVSLPQIIATFDRSGNIVILHEDPAASKRISFSNFGRFHVMTPHFDLVLRQDGKGNSAPYIPLCNFRDDVWNMAINMYRTK